jgi:hypothetical protein
MTAALTVDMYYWHLTYNAIFTTGGALNAQGNATLIDCHLIENTGMNGVCMHKSTTKYCHGIVVRTCTLAQCSELTYV